MITYIILGLIVAVACSVLVWVTWRRKPARTYAPFRLADIPEGYKVPGQSSEIHFNDGTTSRTEDVVPGLPLSLLFDETLSSTLDATPDTSDSFAGGGGDFGGGGASDSWDSGGSDCGEGGCD